MPKQRGYAHKHAVLTLVERGGIARSFHVQSTAAAASAADHQGERRPAVPT